MSELRKVLTIDGAGVIAVREEPAPMPKPGQVRIKVRCSCVSPGTELGGVKRRRENPNHDSPAAVFGYQNAGDVIAVGEGCEDIAIGTRVAGIGGGYATHSTDCCIPRNLLVPIPDSVSYEEGALNHLIATALWALRRAQPEIGENFIVAGLGLVGSLSTQWARIAGCHVMGWDTLPMRLAAATANGCHRVVNIAEEDPVAVSREFTRGHGADAGIIAFGGDGTQALHQIYACLKQAPDTHVNGRIVIVGGATITQQFASGLGNVDVRSSARPGPGYHDEAWEHGEEYPPVFVQWSTRRNLEEGLRFIAEGRLNVKPLITHRVAIDDAPAACDTLIENPNDALGVVINMD